jgi:hypothetical protein
VLDAEQLRTAPDRPIALMKALWILGEMTRSSLSSPLCTLWTDHDRAGQRPAVGVDVGGDASVDRF